MKLSVVIKTEFKFPLGVTSIRNVTDTIYIFLIETISASNVKDDLRCLIESDLLFMV